MFELVVTGLDNSWLRKENADGTDPTHQEKPSVPSEVSCARRKKKYNPGLVVPHPKNRGGDPMAPTRLRELAGDLVRDGYDVIEANTDGVAVQQKPEAKDFQ